MEFVKLSDGGYILRSQCHSEDPTDVALDLLLLSIPLHSTYKGQVTWTELRRAYSQRSSTAAKSFTFEIFYSGIQASLLERKDSLGRKTACFVRRGGHDDVKLSLVVFPDAVSGIEYELISVRLKEISTNMDKTREWSKCLEAIVDERSKLKADVKNLEDNEKNLVDDLTKLRDSFDSWTHDKVETYETDIYIQFCNVLNAKKAKIRSLLRAVEYHEKAHKDAVEKLERLQKEKGDDKADVDVAMASETNSAEVKVEEIPEDNISLVSPRKKPRLEEETRDNDEVAADVVEKSPSPPPMLFGQSRLRTKGFAVARRPPAKTQQISSHRASPQDDQNPTPQTHARQLSRSDSSDSLLNQL
ncbi:hypothetical protein HDV05_002572 [Chytridiales sp. JEL 0842]|nr:hypothetical protein HDV05_002572 [Chytridiales sp. JEL 0842]